MVLSEKDRGQGRRPPLCVDFRGQAEGIDSMISACTISAVELWANYLI